MRTLTDIRDGMARLARAKARDEAVSATDAAPLAKWTACRAGIDAEAVVARYAVADLAMLVDAVDRLARWFDDAPLARANGVASEAAHDADAAWLRERGFLPCP